MSVFGSVDCDVDRARPETRGSGSRSRASERIDRKLPRIVIADDHRVILDGLKNLLQSHYEVVECVTSAQALVESVLAHRPDAVISDLSMPGDGFESARRIRELAPRIAIVLLTMNASPALAAGALRLGVKAYVLKSEAFDHLEKALEAALDGRTHVSQALAAETLALMSSRSPSELHRDVWTLTKRQFVVLRLLGQGKTMKEVAQRLHISPRTVAFHKYRIMDAMKVKTSAELVRKAVEAKLVGF